MTRFQFESNPDITQPSTTIDGALADLAGAVSVAIEFEVNQRRDEVASVGFTVLVAAYAQWKKSGFVAREAEEVSKAILEAFAM